VGGVWVGEVHRSADLGDPVNHHAADSLSFEGLEEAAGEFGERRSERFAGRPRFDDEGRLILHPVQLRARRCGARERTRPA
jgi:hypothetical protein